MFLFLILSQERRQLVGRHVQVRSLMLCRNQSRLHRVLACLSGRLTFRIRKLKRRFEGKTGTHAERHHPVRCVLHIVLQRPVGVQLGRKPSVRARSNDFIMGADPSAPAFPMAMFEPLTGTCSFARGGKHPTVSSTCLLGPIVVRTCTLYGLILLTNIADDF